MCTTEQTRMFAVSSMQLWSHVQAQSQKKAGQAYRIEGSIVLYRSARASLFRAQKARNPGEPWWNKVFGVPLFLRTLLRLVFVCLHWHKGPPVTMRESIPGNLSC